jgi:hypothetical protein
MSSASSVRVLMQGIVDYAGLFPPASRQMAGAVGEYARHRAGPCAWALGRFVLPAARLEEFDEVSQGDLPREGSRSWALSALLGSDIEEDVAQDPAELLAAIAQTSAKAKIRTGGVTPDAFPSSAQVARFIVRCLGHGVSFKATAGLHHPVRADYPLTYAADAPEGAMFGFLNVLFAVAALHAGLDERVAKSILEEREPAAFRFDATGATWRETPLPRSILERTRESMTAFGSCSFSEPGGDLKALGLL